MRREFSALLNFFAGESPPAWGGGHSEYLPVNIKTSVTLSAGNGVGLVAGAGMETVNGEFRRYPDPSEADGPAGRRQELQEPRGAVEELKKRVGI